MITGDFPPSSSVTRFIVLAAPARIERPTAVEPVKAILSIPGCSTKAAPARGPLPVTMLITPAGNPTSAISSPRRTADAGVSSAGLSTTVQPAATANAILPAAMNSGAFHGVIAPTTPIGSRIEQENVLARGEDSSVSPKILLTQPAL